MNSLIVDNINKKPEEVFDLLHRIMHLFRSAQNRALRDGAHNLTHLEGKILDFLAVHPGATLRDMVAHWKQDKGQLARLVKSLRGQGLVRGENDVADRRSVRLRLTARGEDMQATLSRAVGRLSAEAVAGLSPSQRANLGELLEHLRQNLEKSE